LKFSSVSESPRFLLVLFFDPRRGIANALRQSRNTGKAKPVTKKKTTKKKKNVVGNYMTARVEIFWHQRIPSLPLGVFFCILSGKLPKSSPPNHETPEKATRGPKKSLRKKNVAGNYMTARVVIFWRQRIPSSLFGEL
jgi:hypothetical protein